MSRPLKRRRVSWIGEVFYFKPLGIPMRFLEEVRLEPDEVEVLRLKHVERMEQIEGAKKMDISQSTFQRILTRAQQKVAEAIIKGKAIRIEKENRQR